MWTRQLQIWMLFQTLMLAMCQRLAVYVCLFSHGRAGGVMPSARGQSMMTDMHVDPAAAALDADLDNPAGDVPEGSMAFDVSAQDIADVLSAPSDNVSFNLG